MCVLFYFIQLGAVELQSPESVMHSPSSFLRRRNAMKKRISWNPTVRFRIIPQVWDADKPMLWWTCTETRDCKKREMWRRIIVESNQNDRMWDADDEESSLDEDSSGIDSSDEAADASNKTGHQRRVICDLE